MPSTKTKAFRAGTGAGLAGKTISAAKGVGEDLGLGLDQRLARLNRAGATTSTPTARGTREVYTPGVQFTSNDPLQGTILEEGAIFGLDPLGIFDVPQIQTDIERLDPGYITGLVEDQARRNIMGGIALEEEFDPTVAATRELAMQRMLEQLESGAPTYGRDVEANLIRLMGGGVDMPELQQSELLNLARNEALRELELGYALPQDVANLVARTAAGRTAGAGTMGGMGRDIAARDLGLTSLDLFDRRMDRAAGLGFQEEQTNLAQQGLAANIADMNRRFNLGATESLAGLRGRDFANQFGLAQFTQGIDRPIAGLDPGDLASFMVADVNQRNELINAANVAQLNTAAGAKESQVGLMGDVFGGLMGMFCWVAREVYQDSRWLKFRQWMLTASDPALFIDYAINGPAYAEELKRNPEMKPLLKWFMDRKIAMI